MKSKFSSFFEGLVTTAIVLVLMQTLLEDSMVILGKSWEIRRIFILTGFAFDLFFTIEFLVRSWNALSHKQFGRYLLFRNGWVDFAASVPLLLFSSTPEFLSYLSNSTFAGTGSLMSMLKIVKVVRIARILRLLRLLKLFQRIRFANSVMIQRHTIRIITTVAATLIITNMIIGAAFTLMDNADVEQSMQTEQQAAMGYLGQLHSDRTESSEIETLVRTRPMILTIKDGNGAIYPQGTGMSLINDLGPGDYLISNVNSYTVWFDTRPIAVSRAKLNLTVFLTTLAVILMILISYSTHLALTTSDPVNVMMRGMSEKSYNLEVKINPDYSTDETYRLARIYNEEYLPAKERDNSGNLDISMDDISDLLKL